MPKKMKHYYSEKLSSNRLKMCYDIAPSRVQQYLQAEIDYVTEHLKKSDCLIELGCGYGRVLKPLVSCVSEIIGIDTSRESIMSAIEFIGRSPKCNYLQVNAISLPFRDHSFDKVVCVQNGISAFKVDQMQLLQESIRITRKGGQCLFSSYAEKFWEDRLDWFLIQSEKGLIGEIDWLKTDSGTIVCKDGFKATTIGPEEFGNFTSELGVNAEIAEIDNSAVFCVISL
ncbi:MAG: class I SAM-dependent methyltransferase [Candidatus Thorarchaeota archaeon]|nr:class I SAM-dependent methyltransferase [Candidatus Thorarchaeota archaeon]